MKRKWLVVIGAILLFSCGPESPQPESVTRALFGFSRQHPLFVDQSVDQIAAWLQEHNFSAVFGGYSDTALVAALHEAGIQVYAEFPVFFGESQWQLYPDSRPILANGAPLSKQGWYAGVNPSHPGVRRDRLNALYRLLSQTQVDGVWLDFIRWPGRWESSRPNLMDTGFDAGTLSRFSRDVGLSAGEEVTPVDGAQRIATELAPLWHRWKCRQITDFVAEARAVVDSVNRPILLGAFVLPWMASDHDSAITRIVGQDIPAMAEFLDIVSPMAYHALCGRDPDWVHQIHDSTRARVSCPVWPVIQVVDDPRRILPQEIQQTAAVASPGLIVFNLTGLTPQKLQALSGSR